MGAAELALIARVRSLARLKMVTDELRMRAVTSRDIGIESPEREAVSDSGRGGRVLIVDDRPASYERIATMLKGEQQVEIETDPSQALFHAADGNYDLVIVSLGLEHFDAVALAHGLLDLIVGKTRADLFGQIRQFNAQRGGLGDECGHGIRKDRLEDGDPGHRQREQAEIARSEDRGEDQKEAEPRQMCRRRAADGPKTLPHRAPSLVVDFVILRESLGMVAEALMIVVRDPQSSAIRR